jgi:hypothetical protein
MVINNNDDNDDDDKERLFWECFVRLLVKLQADRQMESLFLSPYWII